MGGQVKKINIGVSRVFGFLKARVQTKEVGFGL